MEPLRVTVIPLRERPDLCPLLAAAYEREWPDWYGPGGKGDARADLDAFANLAGALPTGVVALRDDGTPLGAAALKASSIRSHLHLSPWAAGGVVLPGFRRHGIGAKLLSALLGEAARLGYPAVYCATGTSASLLSRAGWQRVDRVVHEGQALAVFRCATPVRRA